MKRQLRNRNISRGRDSLNKTERYIIKSCLSYNSTVKRGFGCNREWEQGIKPVQRNNLKLSEIPYHCLRENWAALCRRYGMAEMARLQSHTSQTWKTEAISLRRGQTSLSKFPQPLRRGGGKSPLRATVKGGTGVRSRSGACVGGLAGGLKIRSGKIKYLKNIQLNSRFSCMVSSASAQKVCCGGKKCFSVS